MRNCLALMTHFALVFAGIGELTVMAQEESLSEHRPQLCSGFLGYLDNSTIEGGTVNNSTEEDWGFVTGQCPDNHAVYATLPSTSRRNALAKDVSLTAFCCPLPAQDILSSNVFIEREDCPANTIATGLASVGCEDCRNALVCTEINTNRYELTDVTPGVFWGTSSTFWKHSRRLLPGELPPALKYGISRRNKFFFGFAGCVGYPFGSLVVGKKNKRCQGVLFRQLVYRGLDGDRAKGTPVEMYPKCSVVSSVFSTEPECQE